MSSGFSTVVEALRSIFPLRGHRFTWLVLGTFGALGACSRETPRADGGAAPAKTAPSAGAPTAHAAPVTGFIEDDYAAALASARARRLPLFVDASAVWCHTCLAMRAFVLDDPALRSAEVVWFSFDVEKPGNASVAARYPARVLPTFFLVDPSNESVHGRWEGAATVDQMREFLRDGRRSIELSHAGSLSPDDPLSSLLAGHRAAMSDDHPTAARHFEAALAKAPPSWPRRPDALLALLASRKREKNYAECLELALSTLPSDALGRSATLADFAGTALDCASNARAPSARVKALRELVAKKLRDVARDPRAPMSPDDRGDALRMVWDAEESLGSREGALDAARERLAVLDAAAKRAPSAEVASTFDGARLETLVFLGRAPEAVAFLGQRERELPNDYNPPHRLASAYQALGDHGSALAAIDRAIAKAWGARKARMFDKRADILAKLGRNTEARAALEAAVSHLRSLPPGQKKPELEASLLKRIEDFPAR
jgi:tetratricopeptide (TPR) repeat protein